MPGAALTGRLYLSPLDEGGNSVTAETTRQRPYTHAPTECGRFIKPRFHSRGLKCSVVHAQWRVTTARPLPLPLDSRGTFRWTKDADLGPWPAGAVGPGRPCRRSPAGLRAVVAHGGVAFAGPSEPRAPLPPRSCRHGAPGAQAVPPKPSGPQRTRSPPPQLLREVGGFRFQTHSKKEFWGFKKKKREKERRNLRV